MTFQVLYATRSQTPLDPEVLWSYDPATGASKRFFPGQVNTEALPQTFSGLTVASGSGGFDRVWLAGARFETNIPKDIWSITDPNGGATRHSTYPGGSAGSDYQPTFVAAIGPNAVFTYNDPYFGSELWLANASSDGINLIKDINPTGADGSGPMSFVKAGPYLFFSADDGTNTHGREIYQTDGFSAGTFLYHETQPGWSTVGATDMHYSSFSGLTYFRSGNGIYSTADSPAGTFVSMGNNESFHGGKYFYSGGDILGPTASGMLVSAHRIDTDGFDGVDYNARGVFRVTPGLGVELIARDFEPYLAYAEAADAVTSPAGVAYMLGQSVEDRQEGRGVRLYMTNGSSTLFTPVTLGLTFPEGLNGAFVGDIYFFLAQGPADTGAPAIYRLGADNAATRITSIIGADDVGDIRGFKTIGDHVYFFAQTLTSGREVVNLWRISGVQGADIELVARNVREQAGVVGANLPDAVDSQIGSDGPETLTGTAGADRLEGRGGDDVLTGLAGADILDGGPGKDFADYSTDAAAGGPHGVVVDLVTNTATDGFRSQDTLISIEGAFGTEQSDYMLAGATSATFYGMGGDDTLVGGAAGDALHGGAGADRLYGEGGDDMLFGGAGNDQLFGGPGVDTIYGGDGDDYIQGDGGEFATLVGGAGDDKIYGGAGNDYMVGDDGNDVLVGLGGQDSLYGGAGDDYLVAGDGVGSVLDGGAGSNGLWGAGGDDYMVGGEGSDLIVGGAGNDFQFGNAGDDTHYGGRGMDYIFTNAGNDFVWTDDIGAPQSTDYVYVGGGTGIDTVADFTPGAGPNQDVLVVAAAATGITSFAQVMTTTTQVGVYTVVTLGADQVYLYNVQPFQLTVDNFLFL